MWHIHTVSWIVHFNQRIPQKNLSSCFNQSMKINKTLTSAPEARRVNFCCMWCWSSSTSRDRSCSGSPHQQDAAVGCQQSELRLVPVDDDTSGTGVRWSDTSSSVPLPNTDELNTHQQNLCSCKSHWRFLEKIFEKKVVISTNKV